MRLRFAENCLRPWRHAVMVVAVLLLPSNATRAADAGPGRTNAFRFVELSRPAGAAAPEARPFASAPSGRQVFHGVAFLIGERMGVTGMESARRGEFFPTEVTGIPVGRAARRLHLLHAALDADKDGVPLARLVFHYAGGAEESVRLGYGVHVRNGMKPRSEKQSGLADPNSQLAWASGDVGERGPEFRLFQTSLENPRPGETIVSLDLVSLFSRATPILVALSVEDGESGLPPSRFAPPRNVVRQMRELGDAAYRREFAVRATDVQDGSPLTNATVSLTVTDDDQTYFLGEVAADSSGTCRAPYPPQQTVGFTLLVRAPGHVPVLLSESKTNRAEFSGEFSVALRRGVTAGGVVKAPDGQPIPGVEVAVHEVVKTGPREYRRTDYDTAVTDARGRWSSSSLPPGFAGFSFQLTHPDYRPALYTMPGGAEAPADSASTSRAIRRPVLEDGNVMVFGQEEDARSLRQPVRRAAPLPEVTSNALLAATAEMVLQPAILVQGTLLDSDGKPVANAEIMFQRNNPAYERRRLKTDDAGRFRTMAAEPGDGALLVIRAGQTPTFRPVKIQPGLAPIEIKLAPARVLRGRVIDRQQRGVPGAKVRLDEWQGTDDLLRFQALTDAEGRFSWTGAPPDQLTFYLSKTNYYNARHRAAATGGEMTLFLSRSPGVSGRVYDAETRKPVEAFIIIPGRKYGPGDVQIHWERNDPTRGRNGEYTIHLQEYYFQPEARIMVEAPGYVPQVSPGYTTADSYTNDFALQRGQGLSGVVQLPDGTPAANATLVLVDKNETAYMDAPGLFRGASSGGDFNRSDAQGRFEFTPKLETDAILVAHERGYAEVKPGEITAAGRIVLQPWGRVQGVMRVGDQPEPDQSVRLQNRYDRFAEPGRRASALSLYLKAEPDETGRFVVEKVPPGERRIFVEYRFKERNYGETPLSHGLPLDVTPGDTTEVILGGPGRRVVGRVKVVGGEQSDVDWRRDVHKLTLILAPAPVTLPDMAQLTAEERQRAWPDFNQRQREFWQSAAGRARERDERTYVLLFDTNGAFRVENVPPGRYNLAIHATDPEEDYYRQRPIGDVQKEIEVPAVAGAKVNEPFDIGAIELTIASTLKIGKPVPALEARTFDGKPIQLGDFRGRPVLLFFWATFSGTGSYDLQVLKELHNTYGPEDKLVVLGLNLDADARAAATFAQDQGMVWKHAHLGEWSQTKVPAAFGVDGLPSGLLIDGEGRLVARQLRGSALRTAVRKALSTETVAPLARP